MIHLEARRLIHQSTLSGSYRSGLGARCHRVFPDIWIAAAAMAG
jgi:hypothetical protein